MTNKKDVIIIARVNQKTTANKNIPAEVKEKRKMKKLITLIATAILALGCVFGLTACGSNDLVVYTESGFAPFEYVKENEIVGVDVDIMQKVAKNLGKNLKFEDVKFDTIVDAVSAGKLVNVGAAGLSITEARKAKVDFSIPYYTANLYVIYPAAKAAEFESVTNDNGKVGVYWEAFAGKKIGVQNGTTSDLFLGDEIAEGGVLGGQNTEKEGYDTYITALSDIGLNIAALMMDEIPAQTLIANNPNFKCAPLYYQGDHASSDASAQKDEVACDEYAIAVTKGQTELLKAINEVLTELINNVDEKGNNGIQQLLMKHLGINE